MSQSNSIICIIGFVALAALVIYYGETSSNQNDAIISLINGTDGVYEQLETITTNTKELHPSQDIICRMLEGKLWNLQCQYSHATESDQLKGHNPLFRLCPTKSSQYVGFVYSV